MAQLICLSCGQEAEDDDLVCRGCSGNLSRPMVARYPVPGPPSPLPTLGTRGSVTVGKLDEDGVPAEEEQTLVCPHCAAPVPERTNQVCVACQRMLREVRPSATAAIGERTVDVGATRRDAPTAVLRIRFGAVERTVTPGSTLLLGRAPAANTTHGLLNRYDNVSRRHATVGLETDGTAWVRDEHSTNGTFVNSSPVGAGARTPLRDGDVLRLAADCTLGISIGQPRGGDRR